MAIFANALQIKVQGFVGLVSNYPIESKRFRVVCDANLIHDLTFLCPPERGRFLEEVLQHSPLR